MIMFKFLPVLFLVLNLSCKHNNTPTTSKYPNISLAQWSLHQSIFSQTINHLDFARVAADSFDIYTIEYVSQFFESHVNDTAYLDQMIDSCKKYKVNNSLIMVDKEGLTGDTLNSAREQTVKNHYKWIRAAAYLGCNAIRVNANGPGDDLIKVQSAVVKSLRELCDYAAPYNINIVVENHGMHIPGVGWSMAAPSTNGKWLAAVFQQVERDNCKALPDIGNFFNYDLYQGLADLMSYAYGISAKTIAFAPNGEAKEYNYKRIMSLARENNFKGYFGIEYEGGNTAELSEFEGIRKTKALIEKHYNTPTETQQ